MQILGKTLNFNNKGNKVPENGLKLYTIAKYANQEFIKSKSLIPGNIVQILMVFIYIPGVFPTVFYGGIPYF